MTIRNRLPARAVLSVFLAALTCAPEQDERVVCVLTDEECVEEARLRGVEVVLVDESGNLMDRTGGAVTDSSAASLPADKPFWRLQAGDREIEGTMALVGRGEGRLAIQLVSDDAVNLLLVVSDEGAEERQAEEAWLSFGRGEMCELLPDALVRIHLTADRPPRVAGRYDGTLACRDSVLSVRGAFHIPEEAG